MFDYRGKTALITGASSGIGAAFAQALAARGVSLILVARSLDELQRLVGELSGEYQVRVEALAIDLSAPDQISSLAEEVTRRGLTVDLLVNNAGFGLHGPFHTLNGGQEQQEIQLNTSAIVALTHAFLPAMLARSSGAVINVASTLAFQPAPFMAVYGATKAFVLSFTQALAEEYVGRGPRFLALCPGPTATGFYAVSGGDDVFGRMRMRTPRQVVATGLRALERGRTLAVDGRSNRWLVQFTQTLPDRVGARIIGGALRPRDMISR